MRIRAARGKLLWDGDLDLLPCIDTTQQQEPTEWLCYNPGDLCDNTVDNNCEGNIDEGHLKCGNPKMCPTTEICDGQDNDCDGSAGVDEADDDAVREALDEYGNAIKQLAAANIFPGDMLLKNFGVSKQGRVIFYDYDELCPLTECKFRRMPPPRGSAPPRLHGSRHPRRERRGSARRPGWPRRSDQRRLTIRQCSQKFLLNDAYLLGPAGRLRSGWTALPD